MHKPKEMTFAALSARADEIEICDTVADVIGGEDYREISLFLEFETSTRPNGDGYESTTTGKRIIGLALCNLDDPQAEIEIWDRDTAWKRFGRGFVENMEEVE